ncbi:unnamed protein product [Aphanomyces euteiches]|uniref:NAD-dependent epimerase/dehydratase domain-containing protein n=1 Tax=Aphanomyces euteiches TaxID=100861 RepID=A0A6G0WMP0_9STRA|nr:hypothetical protein Ae201684_013546 [Aphanomyces euteiches]KAH9093465.1 hypothetical protein Ae201684P_016093 [Aphanomyces euteiches]KAH9144077.1 hypothetical protein AeRB84_011949 [Aphanomyces euteiches]
MSALSAVARATVKNPPGRVSGSPICATVFGATGFVGRYVCAQLGHTGCTVVTPYRGDDMDARHLKVNGDLGSVAQLPFSVRDRESIRAAVKGSNVVINLIGKHYETKHALPWWINYTYDDVHVQAAKDIAEVCAEENVPRLIHFSSILAKPNSPSIWAASKYRGEVAVRKAFPNANIVRSGSIYGPEDRFLNWYARLGSMIPLIENGSARTQPVNVTDVAQALYALCVDTTINGETFELVGDEEYTNKEIVDYVLDITQHDAQLLNLPLPVAELIGSAIQNLPNPAFTKDWAVRLSLDEVKTSNLPGLRDLQVEPTKMEKEAFSFLFKYNKGGHFQKVDGYH